MTERAGGVGIAADGKSTIEFVDSGSQVLGRYASAKSGVGDARALEILTFPCGGFGIIDGLGARIRNTEKLFHAIVEELRGNGIGRRERSNIW